MPEWKLALKPIEIAPNKWEQIVFVLIDDAVFEDWVNRDSVLDKIQSQLGRRSALVTEESKVYAAKEILDALESRGFSLERMDWKTANLRI